MWITSDGTKTVHKELWLLSMSKNLKVSRTRLRKTIEAIFGVKLDAQGNPSRVVIVASIYYWLAGLMAGTFNVGEVPYTAHGIIAHYSRSASCRSFALDLISRASNARQ